MKKCIFAIFIIVFPFLASAQSLEELEEVFVFDYDLIKLAEETDLEPLFDKFFVISASVHDVEVLDRNTETFTAVVTLMDGKWIGLSQVKSYKGLFVFQGQEYLPNIPIRPPREITPEMIVKNKELTVLAQFIDYQIGENSIIPIFQVYKFRMN